MDAVDLHNSRVWECLFTRGGMEFCLWNSHSKVALFVICLARGNSLLVCSTDITQTRLSVLALQAEQLVYKRPRARSNVITPAR